MCLFLPEAINHPVFEVIYGNTEKSDCQSYSEQQIQSITDVSVASMITGYDCLYKVKVQRFSSAI